MASDVSSEAIEAFRRYQSNLRWARVNGEALEQYAGQFVAVSNGRVLEAARDPSELERKYHDVPGVYIASVLRRGLRWVL